MDTWKVCRILVVVSIFLTFSPLITPSGKHDPFFLGMPYTLWVGILEAFILVSITWLATKVHPGREE